MVSLFERLAKGRPPEPAPRAPLPTSWAAQKLLDWLQNVWKKPTVRANDIHQFGPNSIRDRKILLNAAEILVRRGWLVPLPTRRHDANLWQIAVGPPKAKDYRARYSVAPR